MKKLSTLLFLSLTLFLTCGKKEKSKETGFSRYDPAFAIMPDSNLLLVDTVHLYALRDSNLALFERSRQQGQYKKAREYNELYFIYNDSALKVSRNREIAGVRAAYDHERLTGEQQRLVLEKARAQTTRLILLSVGICIAGGIIILYQRLMIRKTRSIREAKKRIRELAGQIALNEIAIRSNENLIRTIGEQLEQQAELEDQLHEQQADITRINETNTHLSRDNERMESQMKEYTSLLQDDKTEQADINHLLEINHALQEKEKHFFELLVQQLTTINLLKEFPHLITSEEERLVMEEMEAVYPGFAAYLQKTFPNLSNLDRLTCCLIKLIFTIPRIALVTGVDVASVSKRKLRIKEDMQAMIPDIWNSEESLDVYLYKLTADN